MRPGLSDPSPNPTSACPVHFLWDGRGRGRLFVRGGFLGLVASGMVGTGGMLVGADAAAPLALSVLGLSGVVWSIGQALSFFAARSASR